MPPPHKYASKLVLAKIECLYMPNHLIGVKNTNNFVH